MAERSAEILLIDDSRDDVDLTLRALRKNSRGRRILVLEDGAKALDYLFGPASRAARDSFETPRVVLLDLKLPLVNGLEVLRRIKSDERMRTVPVVVLTSSREERDLVESYRLGANSYVVKPVDFEEFTEVVRQLGVYWTAFNEVPSSN